ncbi:MAG: hypothetical protein NVV59_04765 [Chitinophagaceae bacterium]|nr:hypothetical protein [Chitinophagaceae bacterium]
MEAMASSFSAAFKMAGELAASAASAADFFKKIAATVFTWRIWMHYAGVKFIIVKRETANVKEQCENMKMRKCERASENMKMRKCENIR